MFTQTDYTIYLLRQSYTTWWIEIIWVIKYSEQIIWIGRVETRFLEFH